MSLIAKTSGRAAVLRSIAAACVVVMAVAACTEDEPQAAEAPTASPDDSDGADTSSASDEATTTQADDGSTADADSVVGMFAGEEWFLGTVPDEAVTADDTAEPVKIGMINQENSPAGSFPEIRAAAEATVAWINAELGGVDGHPLELLTCAADFAPETSQACAQQLVSEGVVAFVGGIDVGAAGSVPVIEQNEMALIGGIPVTLTEIQSGNAFYFSGGTPGGFGGLVAYAINELDARKIVIAYGEFESFDFSAEYAGAVAESLGAEVEYISFPVIGADFLPVLTKAADSDADAILVAAADTSCVPVLQTHKDLGLESTVLMTGACAADGIVDAAGDAIGRALFNSEGPFDDTEEGAIFEEVVERYATEPAMGAGTVSIRTVMNAWAALSAIGADSLEPTAILEYMRSRENEPSFWGHPYTCAAEQLQGMPALCAPQQYIFHIVDDEVVGMPNNFVDVAELDAALH